MLNRRGLITGLISLCAAPAIVRAESLMKLAPIKHLKYDNISMREITEYVVTDVRIGTLDVLYGFSFPRPEWTKDSFGVIKVGDIITI